MTGPSAVPPPGAVVGVGVDLCEVARMRATLARTPSFRDRVFTAGERATCEQRRDPAERFAARFAAKEAVLKAMGLGIGACRLAEIEVVRAASGAPSLVLYGTAARLAADRGITAWHVSMTHTATMAQALAVATSAPSVTSGTSR
ncbi:MAG TPA: holo-ACP synthase [Acidimicrobiales bacterium]|nr:holo-ACP synthase [Acidimicrobiales bacterium]